MWTWTSHEHSDQENLTWCWLRAVEWGRWPIFLSQPFAPIFLWFIDWRFVVIGIVIANLLWAGLVRYSYVNVSAAYIGVFVVKIKWITGPLFAYLLYSKGNTFVAALSLFWPLLIFILGALPTTQIGLIQNMFMAQLGYERRVDI